jgi:hypothetical protein
VTGTKTPREFTDEDRAQAAADIVRRANEDADQIINRAVRRFVETYNEIDIPSMRAAVLYDLRRDIGRSEEPPPRERKKWSARTLLLGMVRPIFGA